MIILLEKRKYFGIKAINKTSAKLSIIILTKKNIMS